MGLRKKVVLFTLGIVTVLTGVSLLVIKRSVEDQAHANLARQLRQTHTVFETFMSDRADWLRSQCRVVAEDPRFTATLDIHSPDRGFHERTVTREAVRFQQIVGSDLFTVYGREGNVLCRLAVSSDTTANTDGIPTLARALFGDGDAGVWHRTTDTLYVASVPILDSTAVAGSFTIGYTEPIDGDALISDLRAVVSNGRFSRALQSRREAAFQSHEMLKAFGCDFSALTDRDGRVLGASRRTVMSGTDGFAFPGVQAALAGREMTGLHIDRGSVVQGSVVPIWSGNDIVGALDTGFLVDREVAFGLRDLMQTEVSFILDDRILASTWSDADRSVVAGLIPAEDPADVFEMVVGGERYLTLMRPLEGVDPERRGRYLIQLSVDEATAFLTNVNNALLAVGAGVLLLASLMSIAGASRIVQPIIALSEAARRLGTRGRAEPIPVRSHDEVGDLTTSFNEMTTALTRSQEALASSERIYRDLFESAQDVVYTADLSMNLISMNQVGLRLFGLEADSFAGRSLPSLLEEEEAMRLREAERILQEGGFRPTVEFQVAHPDGSVVSLEVTTRWLFEQGKPVGIHGIGRDITARREREEATSRFREQLHQAEKLRALGEMAAGVAHNFNNLLTGVMGYAELMKMKGDLPEHLVSNADKIVESAKRCAAVIRRIQGFGRPTEVSAMHPVDINQVIRDTVDITRPKWKTTPETEGRQIAIDLNLGNIPLVQGSDSVWEEILSNLIFNAVDAMPDGGTVTIASRPDGDRFAISVSDNGVGMDEATKRRVFEPFFTTKGPEYGTGLGLSTVYALTNAQNGRISLESTPGEGTTFTISVLGAQDAGAAVALSERQLKPDLAILIVDDEPFVRDLIPGLLPDQNVSVVEDGKSALHLLETRRFDVVVTDWVMSEMSGIDLAERIKDRWPDTYVLLMTGWEFDQSTVPGASAVDGVLDKPFDTVKLSRALAELFVEGDDGSLA